ncbi:MAG: DUF1236 domain-containing protein [Alphaproteobacteria bacterium]|nr:DUF1236 domain-containing protein [Alphaproteobacteria bacterium]
MRQTLLSIVTAAALATGASIAMAQSTASTNTTTTWTNDHGTMFREHSKTQSYSSINDPALNPSVGVVLPNTVTVHPLPPTVKVPSAENYSYAIINQNPVVVERESRKVIHTWD